MRYNDNPLVSVIIPIYNVEKYLSECLDSVINQTYRNLEIILVDDGSTDNSSDICSEYANIDKRIKVVRQNNRGLVGARKAGISIATGEIATFVDSDDWIDLNMYKVMVKAMVESEADIVTSGLIREYGSYFLIDPEEIKSGIYNNAELEEVIKCNLIDKDKFFKNNISIHIYNKLYERKLLLHNQLSIPEDITVGEDAACVYPCVLESNKIVVLNEFFYHYRIRNDSIMGQSNVKDLYRIKRLYQYLSLRFEDHPNKLILNEQLCLLTIYFILLASPEQLVNKDKNYLSYYPQVKKGNRILVYGAGRAGKALMQVLNNKKDFIIVDWLDKNSLVHNFDKYEFDYIIIAVYLYSAYDEIYKMLINMGVSRNKIAKLDFCELQDIDELLSL
ncbi:hypothetical protein LXJ15735_03780 [Lacrimispora xylanolytica]